MRKIQHIVSSVIILYDELTGRPVKNDIFTVTDQSGKKALYKDNGIYVFTGDYSCLMDIDINSQWYQNKRVQIKMNPGGMISRIWMMPSVKNPGLSQVTVLMGTAAPNVEIKFIVCTDESGYRLLQELDTGDDSVNIYHLPYDYIQGRTFRIADNDTEKHEDIELDGESGYNRFLLKTPAKMMHIPEKSFVYRITRINADDTGEYLAVFRNIPVCGSRCIIETDGKVHETDLKYNQLQRCEIG